MDYERHRDISAHGSSPTLNNFRANFLLILCNPSCIWSDNIAVHESYNVQLSSSQLQAAPSHPHSEVADSFTLHGTTTSPAQSCSAGAN